MKAQEYLIAKGIKYIHQPKKFYNLTIGEMIEFLEDFAQGEKQSVIKLMEMNRVQQSVIEACKKV
jgi:hypothetical protein